MGVFLPVFVGVLFRVDAQHLPGSDARTRNFPPVSLAKVEQVHLNRES
jgi:hypothetical protein